MTTIKKVYLFANFATFAGFAVAFYAAPRALGEAIGMRFENPAALADFRAMYGGLCLASAYVLGRGLRDKAHERSSIVFAVLGAAALAAGRLLTFATEGPGGPFVYASLASEVLAIGIGLALLRGGEATEGAREAVA